MTISETHGQLVVVTTNQTADGDSDSMFRYLHGTKPANLYVTGDLGGGTLQVYSNSPDDEWIPINGTEITEIGMYILLTAPFIGKCVLTGSTAADITVTIQGSVVDFIE